MTVVELIIPLGYPQIKVAHTQLQLFQCPGALGFAPTAHEAGKEAMPSPYGLFRVRR